MLRTLNLPDHDPLINEMFSDFDETIFPWMTDGFDPLPDANLSNDDLLTDAVSEMLKCKTELTCSDFPNSSENFSDVVVGDEVEINATILAGSTHQGVVGKHHVDSSGYTSGNLSSTYLSPSNSTSSQVASPLSVDVTQPSNLPNSSIKVSSDYPMQRKNILQASLFKRSDEASEPPILTSKRTFNKRDFTPGNRVHLILHNNPSSIKFSNKGSDLERGLHLFDIISSHNLFLGKPGTLYLNKTLSHPSDFVYPCSDEKRFTESPMFNGSHSSSDSDMKYNSDDDQMINPAYAKYEDTFGHEHVQQPRSSTNLTRAVGTFKRTASPISKLSHFKYGFDEETGYNYQHTARLFRSQLSSSRIRSPIRLDRNDSGLVMLTSEEKRTLIAEGYTIPTRMPLTKQEERNLKKVRRKIKNKISAQESRRKKKEYLESLERKVSVYSQENVELRRRVDGLENTNRSLLGQLRLLQQLVSKSKNSVTSTPVKSSFTISPSNNNNTHPTVSGHKPPAGHQQQQQQRQCAPGNGLVSASAATGASGDSEGGPSSTCLMVFALCFVALLVGQPLQPVSQSTTGTALSSVTSQIFTSSLLGSPSQVGYSWSPPSSHRSKSRPGQTHLFQSTWLARQYFHWMGSSRGLQKHDHLAASTCSVEAGIEAGPTWTDGMVNPDGVGSTEGASPQTGGSTGSQPMVMGEWKSEPRSRLLGSPSELAECSAPPRRTTFWSSLFGGSETAGVPKSTMGGICTQLEYGDPGTLDSVTGNYWPPGPVRSLSRESVARFGRQHLNRSTVDSDQLPYSADQDATSPNLSTAFISANMTLMSA